MVASKKFKNIFLWNYSDNKLKFAETLHHWLLINAKA